MKLEEIKRIREILGRYLDSLVPKIDRFTKEEIISFAIESIQCKSATYEQIWDKVHRDVLE